MTLTILAAEQGTGDTVMDGFTNLLVRITNKLSLSDDGTRVMVKEGEGFTKLAAAYQIIVEELLPEYHPPLFALLSRSLSAQHYRTLCEVINGRRSMNGKEPLDLPDYTPPDNKPLSTSNQINFAELCDILYSIMHQSV